MSDEEGEVQRRVDRVRIETGEDGTTISEVCRKAGINDATFYAWRKWSEPRDFFQFEQDDTGHASCGVTYCLHIVF